MPRDASLAPTLSKVEPPIESPDVLPIEPPVVLPVEPPAELPIEPPVEPAQTAQDRRSVRTKRLLRGAFTQLIEERGLDGFSVGDLTDRADINRATFYAHYRDMNDLLGSFEEEINASLLSLKPKIQAVGISELFIFMNTGTPPRITVEIFDCLREHGPLLRVLLSPKGDAVFQAHLRDRLCSDLVRSVLRRKYTDNPTPLTEYYISYYASAMVGLIQHWLDRGMPESSEEMARIMLSIMMLKPGDSIELQGKGN